jgi:opacity protein-like surface antigen
MFIGVTADVAALSHEMTRDDKLTANIAGHPLYAQQSDTRSSVELWSLMTARLRAGIETERMKYYITGGLAAGLIETETQSRTLGWNILTPGDTQIIASGRSSKSELGLGFAVGGGIEMRLSEEWSLGAEYLYYQIPVSLSNKIEFTNGYNGDPAIYKMDADVGDHLFKIQVNYRPSTWSIFPNTPR